MEIPEILVKNHPRSQFVFPKEKDGNRKCQHSWFAKFKWLHYDEERDCVLCFECIKASKFVKRDNSTFFFGAEKTFLSTGFTNWKIALDRFAKHQNSGFHKKCLDLIFKRENSVPINALLNESLLKSQKEARICLKAIIGSIRFLAKTGLALRGDGDEEGNLVDLLNERSEDVPELKKWLKKRDNYLSGDIQNEILQIMSEEILRNIIGGINNSPFYSIIADGTTDISGKEQISITVRFVDSFSIQEKFVGLYYPDDSKGETIAEAITDILLRFNLPMEKFRGECFDGGSNMSGCRIGVRKFLHDKQPKSVYVHCANHSADLALQDISKKNDKMCEILNMVKFSSNLILDSDKRKRMYQDVVLPPCEEDDDLNSTPSMFPIKLCPTRWCARYSSLQRFKEQYQRIRKTLSDINADKNLILNDRKCTVREYIAKMDKFETYFYLSVSIKVFGPCEILAKALQKPTITATGALQAAKHLIKELEDLKLESSFNSTYEASVKEAKSLNLKFPCSISELGLKVSLRENYLEIHSLLIQELKNRFDQEGLKILVQLEEILLWAVEGKVPDCDVLHEKLGPFSEDFDVDQLHMQLRFVKNLPGKKANNCLELAEVLSNESGTVKDMLQEVIKLLILVMTLPASAATAERSFSVLRRLKTYLRSKMTQKRLNSVMVLHVHKEQTGELDIQKIMHEFISRNEDRKRVFGQI